MTLTNEKKPLGSAIREGQREKVMEKPFVKDNTATSASQLAIQAAEFLTFYRHTLERELASVTDLMAQVRPGMQYWETVEMQTAFLRNLNGFSANRSMVGAMFFDHIRED
jgi:hypothetical protein